MPRGARLLAGLDADLEYPPALASQFSVPASHSVSAFQDPLPNPLCCNLRLAPVASWSIWGHCWDTAPPSHILGTQFKASYMPGTCVTLNLMFLSSWGYSLALPAQAAHSQPQSFTHTIPSDWSTPPPSPPSYSDSLAPPLPRSASAPEAA